MDPKKLLTGCFLISLIQYSVAQTAITIDQGDLPSVGDTLRYTRAVVNPLLNVSQTGANYNWNFKNLVAQSQDIDTFFSVSSTNPIYALVFVNLGINPNRSNLAARGIDFPAAGGIDITEVYDFFYKTSSLYKRTGMGARVMGLPTAIPYDQHDVIYRLPMNYNNRDTSVSSFKVDIPNTLYYGNKQTRINHVDGWGTLQTPFGTYQCLRVKSSLSGSDTIHIDSLGTGLTIPRPATTEYKWLAKGSKIPILQINTQAFLIGPQIITSIIFRDSIRPTLLGIQDQFLHDAEFMVYPNPFTTSFHIQWVKQESHEVRISLYDLTGKKVFNKEVSGSESNIITINLDAENLSLPKGIYTLKLEREGVNYYKKLVAIP